MKWRKISQMFHYYPIQNSLINSLANFAFMCHGHFFARNWLNLKIVTQNLKTHYPRTLFKFVRHPVETREEWVGRLSSWCEINFLWYCCALTRWETPKECAVVVRNLVFPPFRNIITIVIGNNIQQTIKQCAKVQKYEQHKIGLQFFDMWYKYYIKIIKILHGCLFAFEGWPNRA